MTTNDATAPVPTSSNTPTCTVIGSYDISDDEVCELLAFCQPGEPQVGGRTMLARGKADQASMDEAAFQKWWIHREKVPSEFWGKNFAFPEASLASGILRYAYRRSGDWVHYRDSILDDWCSDVVLVRFRRKRS